MDRIPICWPTPFGVPPPNDRSVQAAEGEPPQYGSDPKEVAAASPKWAEPCAGEFRAPPVPFAADLGVASSSKARAPSRSILRPEKPGSNPDEPPGNWTCVPFVERSPCAIRLRVLSSVPRSATRSPERALGTPEAGQPLEHGAVPCQRTARKSTPRNKHFGAFFLDRARPATSMP